MTGIRKMTALTRAGIIESLQFRLSTAVMLFANLIYLALVYFLWKAIYDSSGVDVVNGMTFYDTMIYLVLATAIFNLLESMLPALSCIGLMGVWFDEEDENPLVVFSIWVQQENEGFYLQMGTAATLLRENGIPYFHRPIF